MPPEARRGRLGAEPWVPTILRVLVHGVTAAVFAFPLTHPQAVAAASAGGMAGALLGRQLAATRIRLGVGLLAATAVLVLASLARGLVVRSGVLIPPLGPVEALVVGDALLFGMGTLAVSSGLRLASSRQRALVVLEVALVALAFGQLVVAHRHGAINRPFAIADPILASGGDPAVVFLLIGAVATAVLVALLLSERSVVRSVLHFAVVALLLLGVLGTTRMLGLPPPPPSGEGLGLRADGQGKPREGQPQEGDGGGQRQNEELEFRDNYDESSGQVPVGVVVFHGDYSPPTGVYYFRQGAFSQYNGRRLVAATGTGADEDIATGFPAGGPMEVRASPAAGPHRMEVRTTVGLLADHTRAFGLEAPVRFEPASNPNPGRFKRTYGAVSASLVADYGFMLGRPVGQGGWSTQTRAHYTAAPEDPRYRELADRIVREVLPEQLRDDAVAQALAIKEWLDERGTYSLRSKHAGAEDPTAHFLFGDLTGYCVHFAHAATYLMRSLGLPARVATGYALDEAARQGGSALMLSGSDSHAWPELYVDGMGWVVVDVQPQQVATPPPQPPDPDLQRLLGELLRGQDALPPDADRTLPRMASAARSFGIHLGWALLGLLAASLLLLFGGKLWRRAAPLWARPDALPRVAYRAELDRLSEVAIRRRRGESREAFAARVADTLPSLVPLTHVHVGAAFGSERARQELATVRERARAVRSELRRAVPPWRRLLGVLTPWTWIQVK
jgi:protein-glutamine gamma-glutamyltransferase